ncbi:uncharacterized protein PADG_07681 [Paracoccidioides brasiliensis Pb18]|uniref:Uncharacterized protein n=2 Tax=Paracoccidioides brasiliensis TaxID=121759 RepID=C1GK95_PARBD|nr:uncharacterized protein PADG_07681 [Paracoccidioides brasiliensis Pb18]EEH42861.2 hypothetical protein PADG_07681 [Paracoccidioides brasiliensis Pb18]ODH38479.1 hypothetical protein ACO22_02330 [Paracoccidioides brasiliensis]ODH53713.1 hypothetical protein GX48_00131 [Paracoccidioides brasiliensis]
MVSQPIRFKCDQPLVESPVRGMLDILALPGTAGKSRCPARVYRDSAHVICRHQGVPRCLDVGG